MRVRLWLHRWDQWHTGTIVDFDPRDGKKARHFPVLSLSSHGRPSPFPHATGPLVRLPEHTHDLSHARARKHEGTRRDKRERESWERESWDS